MHICKALNREKIKNLLDENELDGEEIMTTIEKYFYENPRKTVFELSGRVKVRKAKHAGEYTIHMT